MANNDITLHFWPVDDERVVLPTLDPESLAAILFLQLTCRGRYSLKGNTNLLSTPDGRFPYITVKDEPRAVSSFDEILSFLSSRRRQLEQDFSERQLAEQLAWKSYISSHLGDLVSYVLFGDATNYWSFTRRSMAHQLPVPTAYFLPGKVRILYQPRLESEGMWEIPLDEAQGQKGRRGDFMKLGMTKSAIRDENVEIGKKKIKRTFGKEKLLEKVRGYLDPLEKLIQDTSYIGGDGASVCDILLAAHILILLHAPVPHTHIAELLDKSYPRLVRVARLLEIHLTPKSLPAIDVESAVTIDFRAFLPSWIPT